MSKPIYREGDADCSLWETESGWELRMAGEIKPLGHIDTAGAVSALHAAQMQIIERRRRWVV